jgi:cation transport ATPase
MDSMTNIINEKAANAEDLRYRQEMAAKLAEENRQEIHRQKCLRARKRATRQVIIRGAVAVAFCLALWLAMGFGLVAQPLAFICMAIALAVQTFYVGAWVQFIYAKGGFLNVTE